MIELSDHPFFEGTQGHPEFKSRPIMRTLFFGGFVKASVDFKKNKQEPVSL